jgi:hypothetical protein
MWHDIAYSFRSIAKNICDHLARALRERAVDRLRDVNLLGPAATSFIRSTR